MKNVLILGATSDMAHATALRFLNEENYSVTVTARNEEKLNIITNDLSLMSGKTCDGKVLDIMKIDEIETFWNNIASNVDIIISFIGYMGEQNKNERSWSETNKVLTANYTGLVALFNHIANDFENRKNGTIVGISSVAGDRGRGSNYIYGSSKAAFTAYLSGLRSRLNSSNIKVITVKPGFVYTKMTSMLNLPKTLTAKPEDVANVIYERIKKNRDGIVYVKGIWKWIMFLIKSMPEPIFKKLKF